MSKVAPPAEGRTHQFTTHSGADTIEVGRKLARLLKPPQLLLPVSYTHLQNSSITGTLAGQIVMEGFIHLRLSPWLRRLITRTLAIIPTIIVVAVTGERGTEKLLLLSQVILSLQLSFAVIPLVIFTGNRKKMGEFVNGRWLQGLAWATAGLIAGLNAWLLIETAMGH